jgi:protein-disulfide isomerase
VGGFGDLVGVPPATSPKHISGIRAPIVFLSAPMKRYLPYIIVVTVALITFGSGFAFYRATKLAAPNAPKNAPASGNHVRGSKSAAVTIEEFGDFQCPPCSVMATTLQKIEAEYGTRLRLIFHHFPLVNHVHAREAAAAAEAADLQGKFWEMHDVLYREQGLWSKAEKVGPLFEGYAQTIGADRERFESDMKNPKVAERVDADQKLGSSRGVTSTPTLFLNGVLIPADQLNAAALHKAIDEALKEKPKS